MGNRVTMFSLKRFLSMKVLPIIALIVGTNALKCYTCGGLEGPANCADPKEKDLLECPPTVKQCYEFDQYNGLKHTYTRRCAKPSDIDGCVHVNWDTNMPDSIENIEGVGSGAACGQFCDKDNCNNNNEFAKASATSATLTMSILVISIVIKF